ncbi:hypothetical protein ABPG75_001945 [Micractinium tetrahymenae]
MSGRRAQAAGASTSPACAPPSPPAFLSGPCCPCLQGQERTKFVFQGVHETICFGPAATGWGEDEEPINQIVFIGRDLDRKVGACWREQGRAEADQASRT